jgi:hypothetical protein
VCRRSAGPFELAEGGRAAGLQAACPLLHDDALEAEADGQVQNYGGGTEAAVAMTGRAISCR